MDPPTRGCPACRAAVRTATVVAVLVGGFMLVPLRGERWWAGALVGMAMLGATAPLAGSRLHKVLTADRPGFEAAEALAQLLSLLIIGFAAVLYAINHDGANLEGLDTRVDALYFTAATLATVGYGDIHPVSQAARLIVTIQIVFTLVFIGVAVRVFTEAARRRANQKPDGQSGS